MFRLFSFVVVLFLLTTPVSGEPSRPIAYVDMQAVLDKSNMGREARQALKDRFAGTQEALAKEEQSIRQLQQTLARDEALMSQEMVDKKSSEIRERIKEFERKAAQAQRDFLEEQTKLGNEILAPAQGIINDLAKDKKIGAIFERRQSGILYIDDALDLTDDVIEKLNAATKK